MRANALNQKYNVLIHETKEDQERQNNKPSTFRINPTHTSETFPTLKISRQQDQPHQMLSLVDICSQHLWTCHPTPKEETSHPNACNPVLPSLESTASLHQQRHQAHTFSHPENSQPPALDPRTPDNN